MDVLNLWLGFILLCSGFPASKATYAQDEANLQSALLSNYVTTVRPESIVFIYITPVPLSLNSLDISQQEMSFTSIYVISWLDDRLAWIPSHYGNIQDFTVPIERVWIPPIVVENAVTNVGRIGGPNKDNTPVRVLHWGEVRWYPPLSTVTSCEMRISRYPFDTQTCFITLTAWGLSSHEMHMELMPTNMTYYSSNGEWELMNFWTTKGTFDDGNEVYVRLNLHYSYRRKWQFYSQNLILPIVLTSVLMTCVFALPLDCGEKMGYALTVLLAYVVFLTWVTDTLPSVSNDTSILQIYLACVLCLGILATVLTCWVVHMHHREPSYPMSAPMRFVVLYILVPLNKGTCCRRHRRNVVHIQQPPISSRYTTDKREHSAVPGDKQIVCSEQTQEAGDEFKKKALEADLKPETVPTWQEVAAMF